MSLWGARFRAPPDVALTRLSRSDSSYFRLAPYDIVSSQAHARELQRAGILTAAETETISTELEVMKTAFKAGALLPSEQVVGRDGDRCIDWDRRHARSPLGAAALAGSAIALQPERSAAELGYDAPCENSIDAVGSRDHVAEFVFVAAMIGVQLSRLSEEV